MKHLPMHVKLLVWGAVIVAVFASAFWWGSSGGDQPSRPIAPAIVAPAGNPRDIGQGVTVNDDAPDDLTATAVNDATVPFKHLTAVSSVLEVSGPDPTTPFQLNLPVTEQASSDDALVVATAKAVNGPWSLTTGKLTSDDQAVTVETDHLAYWQVLRVDVEAVTDGLNDALLKSLTANRRTSAKAPLCDGKNQAQADGYTVDASAEQMLGWCFGLEDSQRVLKVVNLMSDPVQISVSDLGDPDQSTDDKLVLHPFHQAEFKAALNLGSSGKLRAENSDFAVSLGQFQLSLRLAGIFLERFGTAQDAMGDTKLTKAGFDQIAAASDKMLANSDCADAVTSQSADDIIRSCYSLENLQSAFGWKSLLLAPVMASSQAASFLNRAFDSLEGQLTGSPGAKINVNRSDDFQLGWLAGEWVSCSGPGPSHYLYPNAKGRAEWVQSTTVRKLRLYRQGGDLFGEVTESHRGPDLTGKVLRFRQIDGGGVQMSMDRLSLDFYHLGSPGAQC